MRLGPIEVHPGVFTFHLFSRDECESFLRKMEKQPKQHDQPNSMNKYGKVITSTPLKILVARIQKTHIAPIAKKHFPEINTLKKNPYAFTINYDVKKQRSLSTHYDTSDVTLNVCLGGDFAGGELVLYDEDAERFTLEQSIGRAVIHRGSHLHRAKPLTRGTRTNLVLWCAGKKS